VAIGVAAAVRKRSGARPLVPGEKKDKHGERTRNARALSAEYNQVSSTIEVTAAAALGLRDCGRTHLSEALIHAGLDSGLDVRQLAPESCHLAFDLGHFGLRFRSSKLLGLIDTRHTSERTS
jgi:hypothetical protein